MQIILCFESRLYFIRKAQIILHYLFYATNLIKNTLDYVPNMNNSHSLL